MAVKFLCKFYHQLILIILSINTFTSVNCTFDTGSDSSSSLGSSSSTGSSSSSAAITSSSPANSANSANDKKQEKLINILENLQYSISEILNTLGTPATGNQGSVGGGGARGSVGGNRAGKSDSLNGVTGGGGGGRNPPFSQRIEPTSNVKDYSSTGSRESSGRGIKEEKPLTGINESDSPPIVSGGRAAVTPSDPKKHFPGVVGSGPVTPFRCAATYAGSYGHEYEKPSLHHASHYGVSSNHEFTPHMIEASWTSNIGWDPAFIVPHTNISLYPSAKVLISGQQVYEILQASMGYDNRIRLFRPSVHLERLRRSAARIGLPDFDASELTICLKRLILTDASFLPPSYSNGSLEIRILMIGMDDAMVLKPAEAVKMYIFASRQTSTSSSLPQSLFADSQYARQGIGGVGEYMTSVNDAPTLLVNQIAQSQGYTNVLWLHSKEELITGTTDGAVFVFIINELGKRQLITPPLNGLIVPGVIRQTILEMTRHWNEFEVTERSISIHEIRTLIRQGRLLEMFTANTMTNAVPIVTIYYAPVRALIRIPTLEQRDPLYIRLNRAIHAIEYGLIVHPWGEIV